MENSSKSWMQEAETMLARIDWYITPETKKRLEDRMVTWQQKKVPQDVSVVSQAPLPLLVMRSKGLPQTLDPFYFSLEKELV